MKNDRHPLAYALAGALGALLLAMTLGLVPVRTPADEIGRYQAELSETGNTIIVVDTVTGETWVRLASGQGIAKSEFQLAGKPK
jgi:hypothetical protein